MRASWKGCSCDDAAMVIHVRSESSPLFRGIYRLQFQAGCFSFQEVHENPDWDLLQDSTKPGHEQFKMLGFV